MFKIRDRVIGIGVVDDNDITGLTGTVIWVEDDYDLYGVEFDERPKHGHDCNGRGKDGYCWNCRSEKIELYEENTKPIYSEEDMLKILNI